MSKAKERALVILGAGASIEFGIPATVKFTDKQR
jgi:NAD-dependent SIR2 family protein deacetylase